MKVSETSLFVNLFVKSVQVPEKPPSESSFQRNRDPENTYTVIVLKSSYLASLKHQKEFNSTQEIFENQFFPFLIQFEEIT